MVHSYFKHPNNVGQSYWKHMISMLYLSVWTFLHVSFLCLKAIIHGIFPCILVKSTANTIKRLGKILNSKGCHNIPSVNPVITDENWKTEREKRKEWVDLGESNDCT